VLDVDAVTANTRMQKPRRLDRIEKQPAEFHERVRQGYRELPAREPNRILLIDGSRGEDVIENEIWQILLLRFPLLGKASGIKRQTSNI
jgi:dTMP kinase